VLAPMRPLSTSSRDWEQREIIERHETLRNQIATLTDLVLALRTEQAECTRTTTHVHESAAREVRARGLGRDTKQAPETNISAPQRPHNIQRDSPSRQAAGSGTRNAPRLDEPVSQRVAGEDLCQGLEEAIHRLKSESEEDSGRRDNLTDDAGRQHRNERRQNINPSDIDLADAMEIIRGEVTEHFSAVQAAILEYQEESDERHDVLLQAIASIRRSR